MVEFVILGFVFAFISISIAMFLYVPWGTHRSMMVNNNLGVEVWGYADFQRFLKEYNDPKYNWRTDTDFKESIFSEPDIPIRDRERFYDGYIHAGIIRFGDKGMVLDPISYFRFLRWKTKEIDRLNSMKNDTDSGPRYEAW